MKARRVDVLSTMGGVGKTLLALRLAHAQAQRSGRPVLLVDADLTGPCLGDVVEAAVNWENAADLVRLICGRPELLPEELDRDHLPVYVQREHVPADLQPERASPSAGPGALLFCPSVAPSADITRVHPEVIHALLGNESAGGWVGYVIEQVIDATERMLGRTGSDAKLGGTIVDHGASMGPLQWATLAGCNDDEDRRLLFVSTADMVDLTAVVQLDRAIEKLFPKIGARRRWVINRVDRDHDWKASVRSRITDMSDPERWLHDALPVFKDQAAAGAYAKGTLQPGQDGDAAQTEAVRAALFEG